MKVLAGSRASRLNPAEPRPAAGRPDVPPFLDADALAEWERIVPLLEVMGVLSRVDGASLAIYCRAHSRYLKAQRSIEDDGLHLVSGAEVDPVTGDQIKSGVVKTNPAVSALASAEAVMIKVLASFGCDPSSRSKVSAPTAPPSDPFAEFMQRKNTR